MRVTPPGRGSPPRSRALRQSGQSRRRAATANSTAPPGRRKRRPTSPQGGEVKYQLPLGVLRSLPCALQAVLLPFFHARIARKQPGLLQHRAEVRVVLDERPGDAVRDGAGLAALSAAE